MAVLIPNMKLPESCWECPCMRHDSLEGIHAYQCNVSLNSAIDTHEVSPKVLTDKLMYRFCPLKEVSEWKEAKA